MSEYNRGSVIRYYRKQKNMTQEELADGICDTYTLARYESGGVSPSEENFQKIMNKLRMSQFFSIYRQKMPISQKSGIGYYGYLKKGIIKGQKMK